MRARVATHHAARGVRVVGRMRARRVVRHGRQQRLRLRLREQAEVGGVVEELAHDGRQAAQVRLRGWRGASGSMDEGRM
jgi:hypothetical protein